MATLPQLIEEDIRELNRALEELLIKSEANSALIIDKGGFLISQCGEYQDLDTTTLAALSAASYAATQSIAGLVNETDFTSVYQQGQTFSILVRNVDEYCLLTVVFKAKLSVGAVKYYSDPAIQAIAEQLKRAHDRAPEGGLDLSMANLADPSPLFK
ncbi:MAG TPA: roadblock/LC7 domain-containing protein, partial [Verrucomicrobiae bacterium]